VSARRRASGTSRAAPRAGAVQTGLASVMRGGRVQTVTFALPMWGGARARTLATGTRAQSMGDVLRMEVASACQASRVRRATSAGQDTLVRSAMSNATSVLHVTGVGCVGQMVFAFAEKSSVGRIARCVRVEG
jgi:hypothetical protein